MAQAKIDYAPLKAFFFTGLSLKEVADHSGISYVAIKKHAERNKWYQEREAAQKKASLIVANRQTTLKNHDPEHPPILDTATLITNVLAQRREQYLQNVSKGVAKASDLYAAAAAEADTLEQAGLHAKYMEPVHNLAKTTFGLDAKPDTALQVNIMSSLADQVKFE